MTELYLAPCSHHAKVYACKAWHYSRSVPSGKTASFGAWEEHVFVGVVLFGRGACRHIARPFGLQQQEVVELTRVALREHRTATSKIVSTAVRLLHRTNPGLKLLVSYADPAVGHVGTLYRAMNWTFLGMTNCECTIRLFGRNHHPRSVGARYGHRGIEWLRQHVDPAAQRLVTEPKFKYALALSDDMRLRLSQLAKPYPVRPKEQAPARFPAGLEGAIPIRPLHYDGTVHV